MDAPGVQRAVSIVAAVLFVLALVIGFSPLSVTVIGDARYACGSGFVHSRHTWKVDSRAMLAGAQGFGLSSATPNAACPSEVYGHRDVALVLGGLAMLGVAAVLFG